MDNIGGDILDLYSSDEYLSKNPSLHAEDSYWKVSKLLPLIDRMDFLIGKKEVNILDVGGGAGIILQMVCNHIQENHDVIVRKFALDLSPGALRVQKEKNPDLTMALNEDIRETSLGEKEIDLTLMIDVLEHVPEPEKALKELRRISEYVILRIPLEKNLFHRLVDIKNKGKYRQKMVDDFGHVNVFGYKSIVRQLRDHCGMVIDSSFANCYEYYHQKRKNEIDFKRDFLFTGAEIVAPGLSRLSPSLYSLFLFDFIFLVVQCY